MAAGTGFEPFEFVIQPISNSVNLVGYGTSTSFDPIEHFNKLPYSNLVFNAWKSPESAPSAVVPWLPPTGLG